MLNVVVVAVFPGFLGFDIGLSAVNKTLFEAMYILLLVYKIKKLQHRKDRITKK